MGALRASYPALTSPLPLSNRPTPFHPGSGDLEGYPDAAWASARREVAARAIMSLMQRDPEARGALIESGGVGSVLRLLDSEVRACACGAALPARVQG